MTGCAPRFLRCVITSLTAGWSQPAKPITTKSKRVYYLSLEFLIGRLLRDGLSNMELTGTFQKALADLNVDLNLVEELEPDAALGNGGLGRLAACFMESMATLNIPAYGYGIRYNHGLFRQIIKDGWQTEAPETWLENGNPWEFARREAAYKVSFGGHVTSELKADGTSNTPGMPAKCCSPRPMTRPWWVGRQPRKYACAYGARAHLTPFISMPLTAAIIQAHFQAPTVQKF